jgi:hypothetical protein
VRRLRSAPTSPTPPRRRRRHDNNPPWSHNILGLNRPGTRRPKTPAAPTKAEKEAADADDENDALHPGRRYRGNVDASALGSLRAAVTASPDADHTPASVHIRHGKEWKTVNMVGAVKPEDTPEAGEAANAARLQHRDAVAAAGYPPHLLPLQASGPPTTPA